MNGSFEYVGHRCGDAVCGRKMQIKNFIYFCEMMCNVV